MLLSRKTRIVVVQKLFPLYVAKLCVRLRLRQFLSLAPFDRCREE